MIGECGVRSSASDRPQPLFYSHRTENIRLPSPSLSAGVTSTSLPVHIHPAQGSQIFGPDSLIQRRPQASTSRLASSLFTTTDSRLLDRYPHFLRNHKLLIAMTRFGCRELDYASFDSTTASTSSSSAPSSSLDQPPSTPKKPATHTREMSGQPSPSPASLKRRRSLLSSAKGKEKAGKKTRSRMTKEYKDKVQEAQKKDRLKTKKTQGPSHIYVGNLHPATTNAELKSLFRDCGRIVDVSFRVTRGSTAAQSKHRHRPLREQDRVYAAVKFADQLSPLKAERLNGTVLNGLPIVVCFKAVELPDLREITKGQKEPPEVPERRPQGFFRPMAEGIWERITRENTERVRFPDDPNAQPIPRNKVMGMSMPLTIL
ncbi:hypothetical protein OE88DRAFT_1652631 [Heliocybe sulcata]|uniref:RRM domain-containing protein n=1 Tax=Heliocybe sulcata TaxID=5364 RepID=A0A5C3NQR8_9AGAM|nr:hypothetical protein OE88DRAFT_1652631 [Heliocybe sulcata]